MRHAAWLLLLLGGCESIDPYTRPGIWRPTGANEANLRAQVAEPAMLERGVDDPRTDGQAMASAVHRYRSGRVRALPATGVARLQETGSAGQQQAGSGGGDGGR